MATTSSTTTEGQNPESDKYELKTTRRYRGVVKWLDTQGFGYILSDDTKELLITPSSFKLSYDDEEQQNGSRTTIREGDRVSFRIMERNSIPYYKAADVVPVGFQCYICSGFGHLACNCPQRGVFSVKCYRCGLTGHYSRDCDQVLDKKSSSAKIFDYLNCSAGEGRKVSGSVVCVKRREDVKKVEQVEDCFILEFNPWKIDNGALDYNHNHDYQEDCRELGSIVCVKRMEDVKKVEEVEECFILDFDPSDPVKFSSLSLCAPKTVPLTVQEDDVSILAEKGQVACRDYPHPRHLCSIHPFDKTPHETHCKLCYCYACDVPAPCAEWNEGSRHCDATDKRLKWRIQRDLRKCRGTYCKGEKCGGSC